MLTSFFRLAMAFLLVDSCLSQSKGGVDQTVALPAVQNILSIAQRSGSLEYWGLCDVGKPRSDFPRLRDVSGHEGSARDLLQELFADDPKMRVSEESDGKIRMAEIDVPKDLLEIKIHSLSFPSNYHGPKMAVMAILHSQEVLKVMTERNIVRQGRWGLPGDDSIAIKKPSVSGELNNVTVKQALDYVLQTFPGYWTYQNCHDAEGRRRVSFGFYNNLDSAGTAPHQKPN